MYLKKIYPGKFFLVSLLCLWLMPLHAAIGQRSIEDSLRALIGETKGLEQYKHLIALTRQLAASDNHAALEHAMKAHEVAKAMGDTTAIVESGRICGQLLNRIGRHTEAVEVLGEVAGPAERNGLRADLKTILSNKGIAHTFQAEYGEALGLHFRALVLNEQDRDSLEMGFTLNNIGLVYYRMSNYEEALKYYTRSYNIRKLLDDTYELETTLLNIGFSHSRLEQHTEAREYFLLALKQCAASCAPQFLAQVNLGIGITYKAQKLFAEAQPYLTTALTRAREAGNERLIAEALFALSEIDIQNGDFARAVDALNEAEPIAASQRLDELLLSIYQGRAEIAQRQGRTEDAVTYLQRYIALNKSVFHDELAEQIGQMKSDYEQRENLATIRDKERTIIQQRETNMYTTATALLCGVLVLVLFQTNRTTRKVNAKLSLAQDTIVEQNKQLQLKNRELDQKVEKKTEELKVINLQLKEMNAEVDNFIQKTSQDIRGPLASLKGICNVAMLDIKDPATNVYLERISDTTEQLNAILRRLLAINRISNSRPTFSRIDFKKIIDGIISGVQRKGLPSNLVIRRSIGEDAHLISDPELVALVLENSIEQVIRFCKESPQEQFFIEIHVEAARNGRVGIRLVDNASTRSEMLSRHQGLFMDTELTAADDHDLYFVKTAALKIGGHVDLGRTREGFSELSLLLSAEPVAPGSLEHSRMRA